MGKAYRDRNFTLINMVPLVSDQSLIAFALLGLIYVNSVNVKFPCI